MAARTPRRDDTPGRYGIERAIGRGGMGRIYAGRISIAPGVERPVAIKRMHPHLNSDPMFVDMFLDEAQLLAQIDHPNVCRVIDFGRDAESYFLALEYLEGCSVSELVQRTAKQPQLLKSSRWCSVAARIIAEASEGLHVAHELRDEAGKPLDVVHRDVSPPNIFVTRQGAVKVLDFGVALARVRRQETEIGKIKGKFAYIAPEQIAGARADRRADIWALGVCLWEMLTGRALFRGSTDYKTLLAVHEGAIPRPSSLNPAVPVFLDAVVAGALERDPRARFQTAHELGRALRDFIRQFGEPVAMGEIAEWLTTVGVDAASGRAPEASGEVRIEPHEPQATLSQPATREIRMPAGRNSEPPAAPPAQPSFVDRLKHDLRIVLALVMGAAIWLAAASPGSHVLAATYAALMQARAMADTAR